MTSTMKIEGGNQVWRNQDGKFHRLDGPAVIYPNGTQLWYIEGKYHRNDGPAVIGSDGYQVWYVDGKLHRLDGPAVIYPNGFEEWWIRGNNITEKVNLWLKQNNKSYPFDLNTQILFKLIFG